MKKLLLFAIVFFMAVLFEYSINGASEQEFFDIDSPLLIEELNRDKGISNLSVSSIVQDKYGIIWFGTQDGLNRYDGKEIEVYKNEPFEKGDLQHNLIQTMYYDKEDHTLWIGTYNGLSRFNIKEESFTEYLPKTEMEEGLSESVVIAIEKDQDDCIWVGTANGLDKINLESGDVDNYVLPSNTVRSLHVTDDNQVMIGTIDGLYIYNRDENIFERRLLGLESEVIMSIDEFEEDVFTLGIWGSGIVQLRKDFQDYELITFDNNDIYCVTETADGTIWAGTWGQGLFALDDSGQVHVFSNASKINTISHNVVYSFLEDKSGILWVGTNGGGVNIINPTKRNYVFATNNSNDPSSIDKGKINSIYQDEDDTFWVGVYSKGIDRLDKEGKVIKRYSLELENNIGNQVKVIYRDSNNRLITGTENGLSLYNENSDRFELWDILPNKNRVYCLIEDNNDGFWIGTYDEGLIYYDSSEESLTYYNIIDDKVFAMLLDSQGRLWVGTNNGLNVKFTDSKEFKSYVIQKHETGELPSNTIQNLFEDNKGRIWIATDSGVAYYNEAVDSFTSFTEKDGLIANNVFAVLQCSHDRIWFATSGGISILKEESGTFENLTPQNGIGGWEFGTAAILDKHNDLLFTGIHGITKISDKHIYNQSFVPPILITNVLIYNEKLPTEHVIYNDKRYVLQPDENSINMEFIALDYMAPKDISYEYKIRELKDEWQNIGGNGNLTFSKLEAGIYTVDLRGKLADGSYSDTVSVTFDLKQHWYLRWYSFVLYLLIIIGLVYIIVEASNSRVVSKRNKELDSLNMKLEEANVELEKLSVMDSLTGLHNRRYFDMKFEEQLHLAIRGRNHISLIMIDLDDFKSINDNYGHTVGDVYLKMIAQMLKKSINRSTDAACRYGGDEFIVMLYDNTLDSTLRIAEEIKEKISGFEMEDEYFGNSIRGTASLGIVSVVPKIGEGVSELLEAVDEALYKSKNNGKNKISITRVNGNG